MMLLNRFKLITALLLTVGALMGTVCTGCQANAASETLPRFDFTQGQDTMGWEPTHDVTALKMSPDGMVIDINGNDPYLQGPARDYPPGQPLWLRLRLKSEQGGMGQVFYFRGGATEQDSVRFPVRAGTWEEVRVPLPPLGPGYHFRFDPPGTGGKAILALLAVEARTLIQEPSWPQSLPPVIPENSPAVHSGDLKLIHAPNQWGGFAVEVAGQRMAVGLTRPFIGYLYNDKSQWLDLSAQATVRAAKEGNSLVVTATAPDPDGAVWRLRQQFRPSPHPGAMDVEIQVTVDQDRSVIFLPLFAVMPGVGSFGGSKGQGLFAGLEYLDNEPSSSQADLTVPAYKRQVPDSLKITFPLMAIQAQDRYVGLIWEEKETFSALFDSPDRLFHSGGHLMGVLFPGSDGHNRAEGSLLPYFGQILAANTPLLLHAMLIGGQGKSVVPAVQQYVALRGLPPLPDAGVNLQGYVSQAASGWLDSKIREGNLYRHAYPGSFEPHPTADAALMMSWLAGKSADADLSRRLESAAAAAIAEVRPEDYNDAHVSHVSFPVASLIFGHVAENTDRAQGSGHSLLGRFEGDGSVLYHPSANGSDLGKTHFAHDANGLTAQVVRTLLEKAMVSGDPALLKEGLQTLRALDKFENTVPRGAQTWEVPLHTPDILASAHLVKAYTMGYELTGDPHFLEQARYWAWTGVPLVYLVNPGKGIVGPYSTIAVLGATQWVAPVWMGLPVQWCGLVYADALYDLMRYDPTGPWKQLADGITVSGIQQSWPAGSGERQGLLPDSFNLVSQSRNDPAINPGTVEANAVRFFHDPPLYDFHAFRENGLLAHAPGAFAHIQEKPGTISFSVESWVQHPYYVLVVGFKKAPRLRINGQETSLAAPHQYLTSQGRLILKLEGKAQVEILVDHL